MDYDLFQSDDDEDILTAFNVATQRLQQETPSHQMELDKQNGEDDDDDDDDGLDILPEFNCTGRDTPKANSYPRAGFVRNGFTHHDHPPYSKWEQICSDFNKEQLQVAAVTQYLYNEACKNIQKLFAAVAGQQQLQAPTTLSNSIWYKTRQQVTQFYHLLLRIHDEHICMETTRFLEDLRQLLNNLLDAEAWKVLYFAEHSKGNDCQAPAYHLYHGVLEWRFLDLILLSGADAPQTLLLSQLERTLDDLVLCASHHYRSKHRPELIHTSAFMCRCTKELWLLLAQLAPKWLHQSQLDIWELFHKAMKGHRTNEADSNAASLAFHEFYAWLRLSLARLCDDTDNESLGAANFQTGSLLKQFLYSQPDEQQRRVYLCLLAPLELQRGRSDPDVLCQLWEYLHRSLNCNFNAGTEQLEQLPLTCPSGAAYVERYSKLLARDQLEDLNLSSFTMYAWLLGRTLKLLPAQQQQGRGNQRQKLLGRIFSKFSAAKLLALNEPGIHHVIELFLCLLLSHEDLTELAPKLREMLLCLALEKLPPVRRILVAKGHMALLLLHARHRLAMDDYVAKLLGQLSAIRNDVEVAAIFVGSLQSVFDLADDFARGEQLLLGPWLTHYVEKCGQASQDRVWQALHSLIQRLGEPRAISGNASGMKEALQQHILPLLRTQYVAGHSTWLPRLAAEFVGLDKEREKLMVNFLQGPEPANMAASAQLIVHLLEERSSQAPAPSPSPSSAIILQVWIKSLVLLTAQHESVASLTGHVVQLEEFQQLAIDPASLAGREPLCAFFGALGRRAQQGDARIRMQLSHRLHAYVNHFELWLPPDRLRSELGSRFYSFLAIVIYNCPSLAYVRSKPSCFFHLSMVRFLLTTQLQAGVTPEGRLPQLVHKIFPVLLQGIGRLPYRTDAYLGKTLEQLILHWTPHFSFSPNAKLVARPYTTLLHADAGGDDGELSQFVLQQLVGHFLVVVRRKAGNHSGLVITLLQQMVESIAADQEQQLLSLLRAVHTPLLEHVMFVDELEHSRGQVLSLHRLIVSHDCFRRSQPARELCLSNLRSLADKHLAHCTYFYFQMLIKLAEQSPELLTPLLPYVREQARLVELKRGAGEDVGIRKCLQRLEQVLPG
ncbi:protein MMS22-like [Drosophila guanche]|uniref:Protein MMS22-like n=1 Tax=Drosophila guanche TaxID=7266 RepID=A0A3B0JCW3_DROGU|nr:protein MMS22-like [Drosophila guanche]SPP78423.1 blast:Protein MMS22-like [Drosophila guanche]